MGKKLLQIFSHPLFALAIFAVMGVLVEIKIVPYIIGGFISIGIIATVLLFSDEQHIKELSLCKKVMIFALTIGLWVAFGYWALGKYHQQENQSQKQTIEKPAVQTEQPQQPTAKENAEELAKKLPPQSIKPPLAKKKEYKQKEPTFKEPLIAKLPPTQPEPQPPKESPPDVGLRFVYPKSPALVIVNLSDSVAREIKWIVAIWNMDLPDRNEPLPIPIQPFDWIKGHRESGPQRLFDDKWIPLLLKPGNRLIGSAVVECPACARGRTYIVYIVWGEGGWFSELENEKSGDLIIPKKLLRDGREAYFKELEATIPMNKRIPIQER